MKHLKKYKKLEFKIGDYVIINKKEPILGKYNGLVFEIIEIDTAFKASPYVLRCINSSTFQYETPFSKYIEKIDTDDIELYLSTIKYNL